MGRGKCCPFFYGCLFGSTACYGIALKSLERAGCFDAMDCCNCAHLEDLARQAQLVEYVYLQEWEPSDKKSKGRGKGKPWDMQRMLDEAYAAGLAAATAATVATPASSTLEATYSMMRLVLRASALALSTARLGTGTAHQ